MAQRTLDPYEVLGLPPDADAEQVARAHRRLAKRYHPDLNPGPEATERMRRINEARQTLSNTGPAPRYAGSGATAGGAAPGGRKGTQYADWPPRASGASGWWTDDSFSDYQRWATWQPRSVRDRPSSVGGGLQQDSFGAAGCAVLVLAFFLLYFLLRLPLY